MVAQDGERDTECLRGRRASDGAYSGAPQRRSGLAFGGPSRRPRACQAVPSGPARGRGPARSHGLARVASPREVGARVADEDEGDEVNFRRQGRAPMLIGASLVVVGAIAAIVLFVAKRASRLPMYNRRYRLLLRLFLRR